MEDSAPATWEHIHQVQTLLLHAVVDLQRRVLEHDQSKLATPEKEAFDEFVPKLKGLTYGSPEYHDCLKQMKPAIDHHNSLNSHHPEHFPDGIRGMTLLDLLEMICDWKAATLRHADGDIRRSIEINQEHFGYSDDVKSLLRNTAEWLASHRNH
jgi:uncharacterized protein DUF5662